jgi:hypothetical protein
MVEELSRRRSLMQSEAALVASSDRRALVLGGYWDLLVGQVATTLQQGQALQAVTLAGILAVEVRKLLWA